MWEDFRLGYIHLFEGVPKQDIGQASLIYKGFLDFAVGYLNTGSIALKSRVVKVIGAC